LVIGITSCTIGDWEHVFWDMERQSHEGDVRGQSGAEGCMSFFVPTAQDLGLLG
jgi:hypothetical protein